MPVPAAGGGKHHIRNAGCMVQPLSKILQNKSETDMSKRRLDYLEQLEAESIYIFREVAAQFEKPALLFSGGKDSITLVHLAIRAFAPGPIPFPLVHIDTGHNFPEALAFRDQLAGQFNARLIVRKVEDTIRKKNLTEPKGKFPSRNWLQT